MTLQLNILASEYFDTYKARLRVDISSALLKMKDRAPSVDDFKFYLANSAVHSSNIEGNQVDIDTYLKAAEFGLHLRTKEIKEIEDLIAAYQFAGSNALSLETILKTHEMVTRSILVKKERGKLRKVQVGVRSQGELMYLAIEPELVRNELEKLCADILALQNARLSTEEIFYYAAMLHLVFVNIHPFVDGNGRMTRLLEKWFLAGLLGDSVWCIVSGKHYWDNRQLYYKNLQIGVNYYQANYERSIPFLLMLPNALSGPV